MLYELTRDMMRRLSMLIGGSKCGLEEGGGMNR